MPLLVEGGGSERDVDHPGDAQDWSIRSIHSIAAPQKYGPKRNTPHSPSLGSAMTLWPTPQFTNIHCPQDKDPGQRDNINNGQTTTTEPHQRTDSNPQLKPKYISMQHESPVDLNTEYGYAIRNTQNTQRGAIRNTQNTQRGSWSWSGWVPMLHPPTPRPTSTNESANRKGATSGW